MELGWELRQALQRLLSSRALSALIVGVLAIGIAASVAVFSLINALVFTPPPVQDPSTLVRVYASSPELGWNRGYLPPAAFNSWVTHSTAVDLAAYSQRGFNVFTGDAPERVSGALVTANYFALLGITPQLGRGFRPDDDQPGAERVVVVSGEYWKQVLAETGFRSRTLEIDGNAHTVIGVLPDNVAVPSVAQLWVPLHSVIDRNSETAALVAVGRLKDGRTVQQVEAALAALTPEQTRWMPNVTAFYDGADEELAPLLGIMLAAVLLVLLVACANVGNLLLARFTARQRELAIRTALGASQRRLVAQLLLEASLLSAAGTAVGVLLALWIVSAGVAAVPQELQLSVAPTLHMRVIAFAVLLTLFTTLVASLGPAKTAARVNLLAVIGAGSARSGERRDVVRLRKYLVVAQVACSVTLLVSAVALYRSARGIAMADWGYDAPEEVLLAHAILPEAVYPNTDAATATFREVQQRLQANPAIRFASGFADEGRLRGAGGVLVEASGAGSVAARDGAFVRRLSVMPGYAETVGLSVLSGRDLAVTDRSGAQRVVLINTTLAATLGISQDAVGRILRVPEMGSGSEGAFTIVGVIEDALEPEFGSNAASLSARPTVYLPVLQHTSRDMIIAVRAAAATLDATNAVRTAVAAVDPRQPLTQIMGLDRYLGFAAAPAKWLAAIFALVGAAAFSLSALGLYGMLAYVTRRRTREFGLRIAVGANRSSIMKLVCRQSAAPLGLGIAIGAAGAFAINQMLRGMLYGVSPNDPRNFFAVVLLVTLLAGLAALRPAFHAARVDPNVALRD